MGPANDNLPEVFCTCAGGTFASVPSPDGRREGLTLGEIIAKYGQQVATDVRLTLASALGSDCMEQGSLRRNTAVTFSLNPEKVVRIGRSLEGPGAATPGLLLFARHVWAEQPVQDNDCAGDASLSNASASYQPTRARLAKAPKPD
jgi:hypothetical protein